MDTLIKSQTFATKSLSAHSLILRVALASDESFENCLNLFKIFEVSVARIHNGCQFSIDFRQLYNLHRNIDDLVREGLDVRDECSQIVQVRCKVPEQREAVTSC